MPVPRRYAPIDRIGQGTEQTREYQLRLPDDDNPDQWSVVDLTEASQVTLTLQHNSRAFTPIFEEPVDITVGDEGRVEYHWTESETFSAAGDYYVQFEVTYNDGTTQLVPSEGYDWWLRLGRRQSVDPLPFRTSSLEADDAWIGDAEIDTLTVVDALNGLSTGSLSTIDGPGLTNDGGTLTMTADFEGIQGMSNPATADLNMDGFAIHSAGSIGGNTLDVGTLASPVDASGNAVTGLPAPSAETDAARLAETSANADSIGTLDAEKADAAGDTLDPAILNNKRIVAPSIPGAFDTIMGAYNDLPATGGTIEYVETVQETGIVFDKPIRLLGQGSERSTTIGAYIDCTGGNGIHINSKAVVLRDVHVEGTSVSTYGIRVGESGNFIENIVLDNVSARNCVNGFHFTGYTQTVRPDILAGGNDIGVLVDGADGNWFNSIMNGTILTQGNDTYGFRAEGGIDFNGNSFWFAGENPNSTFDMSIGGTVTFSGNHITGYGWHDTGLEITSDSGSGNRISARILRGSKDLSGYTGRFEIGYDETGTSPWSMDTGVEKVGARLLTSTTQTVETGGFEVLEVDTSSYDHWRAEFDTFDSVNHTYTIPTSGTWQINAKTIFLDSTSEGQRISIGIRVNGADREITRGVMANTNTSVSATATLYLDEGDVIDARVHQATGSSVDISSNSDYTNLEILKLG